jgi:hypothetical protein
MYESSVKTQDQKSKKYFFQKFFLGAFLIRGMEDFGIPQVLKFNLVRNNFPFTI